MSLSQTTRVSMVFITGTNEYGENTTKTKTLNNVKGNATDEHLVELVTALTALQQNPLAEATRNNSYSIM
ncbi:DUF1659 domain-containing protein [bacterium LRH843]|nr:DUF1659 domain-containing protein [bacterium LRH843]